MDNLQIRKTILKDIKSMDNVNRLVLPENYDLDTWNKIISSPNTISYILEENKNNIVGYIVVVLKNDNQNSIIGHIYSIGIIPKYQHKGYGYKFMKIIENDLITKKSANRITLHVRFSNKPAIKFYTKLKYGKIKKVKEYYGKKQHAWLMTKTIKL